MCEILYSTHIPSPTYVVVHELVGSWICLLVMFPTTIMGEYGTLLMLLGELYAKETCDILILPGRNGQRWQTRLMRILTPESNSTCEKRKWNVRVIAHKSTSEWIVKLSYSLHYQLWISVLSRYMWICRIFKAWRRESRSTIGWFMNLPNFICLQCCCSKQNILYIQKYTKWLLILY